MSVLFDLLTAKVSRETACSDGYVINRDLTAPTPLIECFADRECHSLI
jgi:hypothetical protein